MTYCVIRIKNSLMCHILICKVNKKWQANLTPKVWLAKFTVIKYDYKKLLLCEYLHTEQFFKPVKFKESVVIISEVISNTVMSSNFLGGGAKVLGKLSVRPTNLDNSRARAYCACSRCGWWLFFGHFFFRLSFLFSFSLSGRRSDIDCITLSKGH